jgi:hypothetical protein
VPANRRTQCVPALPLLNVPVLPLRPPRDRGGFPYQPASVCILCFVLLIGMPLGAPSMDAASSSPPSLNSRAASQSEPLSPRLSQTALDRQIARVLQEPEFSWRERAGSSEASPSPKQKSILEQWMAAARQMLQSAGSWIGHLLESLFRPFNLRPPLAEPATSQMPLAPGLIEALGYLLWAGFAGILVLLMIRILKLKTAERPPPIVPSKKPDLADDQIEANQLPDDEWSALAREKIAAGEFRQAQRALFLAILSYLASHRFINVERWKSNADYEKELGRKAKHLSAVPGLFAQSCLGFERCWYGTESVTPEGLENYNQIYERIKHEAV